MRNKSLQRDILFTFLIALVSCSIVFLGYGLKVIVEASDPILEVDKVVYVHSEPERVSEVRTEKEYVTIEVPPAPETELSEADLEALARVVHSEAGNQDMIGRRLVADVVLNRVDSLLYPNTVQEVIEQEGQFKSGGDYTEDDMEAVKLECQNRLDHDVLSFRTGSYHSSGVKLYQHGAHYFSGR